MSDSNAVFSIEVRCPNNEVYRLPFDMTSEACARNFFMFYRILTELTSFMLDEGETLTDEDWNHGIRTNLELGTMSYNDVRQYLQWAIGNLEIAIVDVEAYTMQNGQRHILEIELTNV